ncbi:hypothetical protein [Bacteroides reticulotermitis]|uniref:hypothetical protein n=1 Tax=Bacteroides reticulotermitis TaxID=1133319 RepID=UPI003A89D99C
MKKTLSFIGSAIYGIIFSYLLWLMFHLLTPWLMSFGWLAAILYCFFALGLIAGILGGLSSLLCFPLYRMVSICDSAKYIPVVFLVLCGLSAVALPWQLDIEYSLVKILIAFSISLTAFAVFSSMTYALFKKD